jgi:SAM-dependent methyltransferase
MDLGCGAGEPITSALSHRSKVIALDISEAQLALARERAPAAVLVRADMAELQIRPASLDAVVAFNSIIHVPRRAHGSLYRRIATWLRPRGIFAGALGFTDNPAEDVTDWKGAPMHWSHFDAEGSLNLLRDAGFAIKFEGPSVAKRPTARKAPGLVSSQAKGDSVLPGNIGATLAIRPQS